MLLRKFRLAKRAILVFFIINILVVALGGIALWQMSRVRAAALEIEDNWMDSIREASAINSMVLTLRLESTRLVTASSADVKRISASSVIDTRLKLKQLVDAYQSYVSSAEEQVIYDLVKSSVTNYNTKLDTFLELAQAGDAEAAANYIERNIRVQTNELEAAVGKLIELNRLGGEKTGIEAEEIYQSSIITVVGIDLLVMVISIFLGGIFARSITAPLTVLLDVNRRISEGDLGSDLEVTGKDELADLMAATAAMQVSLRETIRHMSDSSTQLAAAAEEMYSVTEEASASIHRQNNEIEQAATAVNEMSVAVEEVARNAVSASESAQVSELSTRAGADRVSKTVEAIQSLSVIVEETSTDVEGLAIKAQSISRVLDVIRSIAEQTNLLALNAAIEAARAGDQGRGFAVVADEVRALAHRTQESTKEIESMIADIQAGADQAVLAMSNSCVNAQDTLSVANEAGAALAEIAKSIIEINERNFLIATASEEQAQVARSVDSNLVSIRDLSIQTSAGANQAAIASNELSKLAVAMADLAKRFRT
ncbi:methyl-accepting chemotaxis protein [Pseudomonas koreensis]|uniref:methyl-accepting chemotaxis protein n=1 Tax=Pseudomonas koreensis TaxID=198620 RepID=UPI002FC72A7C